MSDSTFIAEAPENYADYQGLIWFNGDMVPWQEAKIHVLTSTLHYGLGVFEGVRAYLNDQNVPCIFRLQEHTERLFNSAHIIQMAMPWTPQQIIEAQCKVVKENELSEGYIRPICFYGSERMGLHADGLSTHVAIAAWPWPAYLGEEHTKKGIRVQTSFFTRHHVNSTMITAKVTGTYYNSILALKAAEAAGYDEALLLDTEGYVSEGSGENIFIAHKGVLYTPCTNTCLAGITRDTIIQLAQEQGYRVEECRLNRDRVYTADEAFFTGTAAEVLPIRELDGRVIGDGNPGEITLTLQELYLDQVRGRRDSHHEWCHPVT